MFDVVLFLLAGLIGIVFPLFLTVRNILRLFITKIPYRLKYDICVFGLGLPLTGFIIPKIPWDKALTLQEDSFHEPITFDVTIGIVLALSVICYWTLRTIKDKLPPLPKTLVMTGLYVGCVYALLWIIQLSEHFIVQQEEPDNGLGDPFTETIYGFRPAVFMAMLFAANYILLSARLVIDYIKNPPSVWPRYESGFLNALSSFLSCCKTLPMAALVTLFPLCLIVLGILTLFGQQPQFLIKAFTDTSDWLFSTKISPPPIQYQGHYLCTVAAKGDRGIVKPLRKGSRHGIPIIVNRQLCAANAFEELIAERSPRLHHFIRDNYDKYGYPICQYINKPWKADLIYLLMKPAEYFFVIILYTFDTHPEQRIARQYQSVKLDDK